MGGICAAFFWMCMFNVIHTWDRTERNPVLVRERKNMLQIMIGSMALTMLAAVIFSPGIV